MQGDFFRRCEPIVTDAIARSGQEAITSTRIPIQEGSTEIRITMPIQEGMTNHTQEGLTYPYTRG